jgi:hypothetical protein
VLSKDTPAFGEGNTMLTQTNTKDSGKRKKPKNNMTKSNSSFISRVIAHESLNKRLQDRPSGGLFAFANINRAFQWLDLSSSTKVGHYTSDRRVFGQADHPLGRLPSQNIVYQGALPLP